MHSGLMMPQIPASIIFLTTGVICALIAVLVEMKARAAPDLFPRLWAMFALCVSVAGFSYYYLWYGGAEHQSARSTLYLPYSAALSFLWLGARDLRGKRLHFTIAMLPPLTISVSRHLGAQLDQPELIIAVFQATTLVFLALTAREIRLAQIEQALRSGRELLAVMAIVALVPAWRLYELATGIDGHAGAVIALGGTVLGITVPMTGLHFLSERQTARHVMARHDQLLSWQQQMQALMKGLPLVASLRRVTPDGSEAVLFRTGDLTAVTGVPEKEFAVSDVPMPFSLESPDFHRAFNRELLASGRASYDWRLQSGDGSVRWMKTHCAVIERDPDGIAHVVGYTVDNTAARAAEAKVVTAARLASLGEMAIGLAHELRQPLTVMALAAENIQRIAAKSDVKGIDVRASRIVENSHRASAIIDNLRSFAIAEKAGADLHAVPLDDALTGTLTLIGGALREASVEVVFDLGDPAPVVIGDEVALQQIFFNLLSNARHALMDLPEDRLRRIAIQARPAEHGLVRITVSDTGDGIPPEIIGRVFEPFVTTKGPDRGTGLGLPITLGLIKNLGGTISVRNAKEGAVFEIHLRAEAV